MSRINIEALRQIANDAFTATEEMKLFNKTLTSHYSEDLDRKTYARYCKLDALEYARWDALQSACSLIGAEQSAVIAFFKAVNRYEKHRGRWDRCVWSVIKYLGTYNNGELFQSLTSEDGELGRQYYRSTGRPICA